MISVNDFKTGLTIEVDGGLWRVVEFQHVKPGKGAAFVRSKLKNLRTGAVQEKTFRAGEKVFEGDAGKGEGVADACAHAATGAKLSVDVRRAVFEGKCASGAYRLASRAA